MKKFAIVSGKGGVGKTSISAAIAYELSLKKRKIIVVDTDVDAPNLSLLLKGKLLIRDPIVTSKKPKIDPELCTQCGKCVTICKSEALSLKSEWKAPRLKSYLCEGCGICKIICPTNAIKLVDKENGFITVYDTIYGFKLISGELEIGGSASGKIVRETKEKAYIFTNNLTDYVLIDGPPGSGCPAISTISDVDVAIFVTEPTPTALHDLKRIVDVKKAFNIPGGVIINKYNLHEKTFLNLKKYINSENLITLGKIPYSDIIPNSIVVGEPLNKIHPDHPISKEISKIVNIIEKL
ncbi:MAG: P-loop NTPase [Candidatus Odinarchaeia archaeon]